MHEHFYFRASERAYSSYFVEHELARKHNATKPKPRAGFNAGGVMNAHLRAGMKPQTWKFRGRYTGNSHVLNNYRVNADLLKLKQKIDGTLKFHLLYKRVERHIHFYAS